MPPTATRSPGASASSSLPQPQKLRRATRVSGSGCCCSCGPGCPGWRSGCPGCRPGSCPSCGRRAWACRTSCRLAAGGLRVAGQAHLDEAAVGDARADLVAGRAVVVRLAVLRADARLRLVADLVQAEAVRALAAVVALAADRLVDRLGALVLLVVDRAAHEVAPAVLVVRARLGADVAELAARVRVAVAVAAAVGAERLLRLRLAAFGARARHRDERTEHHRRRNPVPKLRVHGPLELARPRKTSAPEISQARSVRKSVPRPRAAL